MILIYTGILLMAYIEISIYNDKTQKKNEMLRAVVIVFLLILLFIITFLMWILIPTQWAVPTQFDDDAVDAIRMFAYVELIISIILAHQSWKDKAIRFNWKNRAIRVVLIITNLCAIYKVISTYIIF